MAGITIRNLDEDVKRCLRLRAAKYGRSMEETREILSKAAKPPDATVRPASKTAPEPHL